MKRLAVLVAILAIALVKPAHAVSPEQVYSSSHTATSDSTKTITTGRTQLYKVLISSAGTGSALVTLMDVNGSTLTIVDATALRDLQFDATLPAGLVYSTAGTAAPQVSFLYWRSLNPYGAFVASPYSIFNSTGVYTTRAIRTTRGFLKRVLVTKAGTPPSAVTIYNSNATANNVVDLINSEAVGSRDYNVFVSSGLTYTVTGNPNVTFIYGDAR